MAQHLFRIFLIENIAPVISYKLINTETKNKVTNIRDTSRHNQDG